MDDVQDNTAFQGFYTENQRKLATNKEYKRLKKIFQGLGGNALAVVDRLLQDAAFLSVTLEETRRIINRDGIIEEYRNGQYQYGRKKSSAVEVYDKLVNTYIKAIKQICDALPDDAGEDLSASLLEHLARKPK